jgi:hypothetical protein
MMRDYDATVKNLREAAKGLLFDAMPYRASVMNDAADAIEELLAAVPQWISVEERLPELNQEVFVYAVGQTDGFFGDSVITKCKRCIFKPFPSSEGFENWSSPWQYFHTDYKITYWMPLPKAPKEEN